MFADDTNITVPGCTFAELEQATNSELTNLYSWLKANKLSINIAKTEFMVIGSRQKFLAENFSELNIQLDNQPISRVEHAKSLGLIIDDRLSWSNHISELCRKISSAIGALRRIRLLISISVPPFGMDWVLIYVRNYKNCKTELLGLFCKPTAR